MWFCYLTSRRIDNGDLLFEANYMKKLKLLQVFNVIFNIHDNYLSQISSEIARLEKEKKKYQGEVSTINRFLKEQNVSSPEALEKNT